MIDRPIGPWVKAKASANNGNCVELSSTEGGGAAVRDSKDPGPNMMLDGESFRDFLGRVKSGEYDHLA